MRGSTPRPRRRPRPRKTTSGTDRRGFLRALTALAAAALAGCGRRGDGELEALRASIPADLSCTDVRALWPAELATRTTNEYVDRSARPDQFCLICLNFQPPPAPGRCGACTTVKGPIHPGGWCKSWTAKRG